MTGDKVQRIVNELRSSDLGRALRENAVLKVELADARAALHAVVEAGAAGGGDGESPTVAHSADPPPSRVLAVVDLAQRAPAASAARRLAHRHRSLAARQSDVGSTSPWRRGHCC